MKIDRVFVYGFDPALYGMRNPKESWEKSDTRFYGHFQHQRWPDIQVAENPEIGPNDLDLACRLVKAGGDHRKFLRQILVWWNITIPRAVWQELDTYKVATVRNSCSTMHKLGHRDLELSDFQDEDVDPDTLQEQNAMGFCYRNKSVFLDHRTKKTFEGVKLLAHMKRRLPEGFLQMATYSFSYETALKMWLSRHDHRMPEWSGPGGIAEWLLRLPYLKNFIEAVAGPVG